MGRWRVGVLGAGRMAQAFDDPGSPHVLSMAHAFTRSEQFQLGGFFDSQVDRAAMAEQRWGVPVSPRERTAWLGCGWDVIYVATPDAEHGTDLRDALAQHPRAVLMEKPLAVDGEEAMTLLHEARDRGVVVMVDFPRRWHSSIPRLRAMIERGELSPPTSAFVAISGGALHNLPHVIDLIHTLWDGGWTVQRAAPPAGELTPLVWQRGTHQCSMAVVERRVAHYLWEAHFYCQEGKLALSHSPEVLELAFPAPHPRYGAYRVLGPALRVDMEQEPLLCRLVEALGRALLNPREGAAALEREVDSQRLSSAVLRWFAAEQA